MFVDSYQRLWKRYTKIEQYIKKKMLTAKQAYEKKPKTLEKEIARCNNIQMARKIQLNSAYGAIGNQYSFYKLAKWKSNYFIRASFYPLEKNQEHILKQNIKTENEDYILSSDTDSIYRPWSLVERVYKGRENY